MRFVLSLLLAVGTLPSAAWATEWAYETISGKDGVPLAVAEAGNAKGPALLFIHGFSQSILSWKKQLNDPSLQEKYRMVAVDLRGHGASGKPWTAEDYQDVDWADDIATVIAEKELIQPVLIGWSFGGSVMSAYVRHYGQSDIAGLIFAAGAMALTDVSSLSGTEDVSEDQARAEMVRRMGKMLSPDIGVNMEGTAAFVDSLATVPLGQETKREILVYNMMMPAYARVAMFANQTSYDDLEGRITVPTLLIHGDDDAVVGVELSVLNQPAVPGSRLIRYEGIGHAPFLEAPVRFNADISRFADGLVAAE